MKIIRKPNNKSENIQNPKQLTLLGVGPLTNIALAMKMFPDFSELVKEIYIMGGNYNGQ